MNDDEKRDMVYAYLEAYNSFDIERLVAVLHSDIVFKNVAGAEVTTAAFGVNEFREVAEQSRTVFRSRLQEIRSLEVSVKTPPPYAPDKW
jgi:ketosteroid isomerase-like protein